MIKIKHGDFMALVILFLVGSAVMLDVGRTAFKDGWLAIFIGMLSSLPLLLVYYLVYAAQKGQNFFEIFQYAFGKIGGKFITFLYIVYFIYMTSRILRDFSEVLQIAAFGDVSLVVLALIMMLTIMYYSCKSIDLIFKISKYLFLIIITAFFGSIIFEIVSGVIDIGNELPVLEDGWAPVLKTVYPKIITFPFGELIVIIVFFSKVEEKKGILLKFLAATFIAGAMLMTTSFIHVSILGAKTVERTHFPILTAVSVINISDFIQRVDALIVILIIILGFIKTSIFFIASVETSKQLLGIKENFIIVPLGLLVTYCSMAISANFPQHIEEGINIVPYYLHIPFQIVMPLVMMAVIIIKKKVKKEAIFSS
ncbi:GerAB/ArcD/ProY family transporter [Falsibacillus pallidus]|uniref:Spore germination protein KB n=1 Tax=Falsibacillus pallidus TaxID=493781 RepID=A0A370GQJ8_9BACI|nr:endospore germination permease [Falsibacillus pallidus]RDI45982.1 spore germination protein KB [Falsibacillus pallidus]